MNAGTAILLIAIIVIATVTTGCTTAYPTQTVTVTGKFIKEPTALDWFDQHFIIDEDGLALRVDSSSPTQEAAMYTSMQEGHTYVCEVSRCIDGSNHYCITEIIQEV